MEPYTLSLWIGMAIHTTKLDEPEIDRLDNPMGIVQLDMHLNQRTKLFCKHESSIPTSEDGYGFNECGAMLRLK